MAKYIVTYAVEVDADNPDAAEAAFVQNVNENGIRHEAVTVEKKK